MSLQVCREEGQAIFVVVVVRDLVDGDVVLQYEGVDNFKASCQ